MKAPRAGLMESRGYVSETLPFTLKTLLTPLGLDVWDFSSDFFGIGGLD